MNDILGVGAREEVEADAVGRASRRQRLSRAAKRRRQAQLDTTPVAEDRFATEPSPAKRPALRPSGDLLKRPDLAQPPAPANVLCDPALAASRRRIAEKYFQPLPPGLSAVEIASRVNACFCISSTTAETLLGELELSACFFHACFMVVPNEFPFVFEEIREFTRCFYRKRLQTDPHTSTQRLLILAEAETDARLEGFNSYQVDPSSGLPVFAQLAVRMLLSDRPVAQQLTDMVVRTFGPDELWQDLRTDWTLPVNFTREEDLRLSDRALARGIIVNTLRASP